MLQKKSIPNRYIFNFEEVSFCIISEVLQQADVFYISNQVLNELAAVLYRKYAISPQAIHDYISKILLVAEVRILNVTDTLQALNLIEKYKLSFYDALIVNAALQNQCCRLYSEDMQRGQFIENRLTIVNPFL